MTAWVNRSLDQQARNGTTSHTFTFTQPSANNFLVAIVEGAVTSTTPSGWTLAQSSVNLTGLYVFTKTASGSETSFTTTHNGSNYPAAALVYEFASGSSVAGSAAGTSGVPSFSGPALSSLTGTNHLFGIGGVGTVGTAPSWASWGSSLVEDTDASAAGSPTDGYGLGVAVLESSTLSSLTPTATISNAQSYAGSEGITLAVGLPPTNVTQIATTTGAPASASAAFTPTLPSGYATGDRLILIVGGKYDTTTVPTINQSWTLVGSGTGGTGSTGNDTGLTFWAVYAKDATSASETAPTVTPGATNPNSWEWICTALRHAAGATWADSIAGSAAWVQSASDTSTTAPLTGTAGAWTGVQPTTDDWIMAVGVIPTDVGTAITTASCTMTATGLSGGTKDFTSTNYVENALGNDTAMMFGDWAGFTGTASAGLAVSFTITGTTPNSSGSIVAIAVRQQAGSYTGTASSTVTATTTATGTMDAAGTTALSVTAALVAAGIIAVSGAASVPVTASITAAGSVSAGGLTGTASLAVTDSITTAGIVATATGASLTAIAAATAVGTMAAGQGASLTVTDAITATGVVATSTGATLPATATITAAGSVVASGSGSASLAVTDTITASGVVATSIGSSLAVTAGRTATGVVGAVTGSSLTATAGITAAGTVVAGFSGSASVPVTVTLASAGLVARSSPSSLPVVAIITTAGVVARSSGAIQPVTATITATGAVVSANDGIPVHNPGLVITGSIQGLSITTPTAGMALTMPASRLELT